MNDQESNLQNASDDTYELPSRSPGQSSGFAGVIVFVLGCLLFLGLATAVLFVVVQRRAEQRRFEQVRQDLQQLELAAQNISDFDPQHATATLVLGILSVESSYANNVERPATAVPDTVQFWLTADSQWRIRTYAIDHDIHMYTIGARSDGSRFTAAEAEAHIKKHYGDVIVSSHVLSLSDPNATEEVRRTLNEQKLRGTLEVGKNGVAFYNPDNGEYRTKSEPK